MKFDPFAGAWRDPASHVGGRSVAGESGLRAGPQSGRGARAAAITQADLERLHSLSEQRRQVVAECRALRDGILERLRAGGAAESGRWALSVTQHEERHFTREQLERLLGDEETERLRSLLIPRIQTNVRVTRSS